MYCSVQIYLTLKINPALWYGLKRGLLHGGGGGLEAFKEEILRNKMG